MEYPQSHFSRDFNTPDFEMRPMFLHVRDRLGSNVIGVEIGVYLGENAEYVLKNLRPTKYYMIDAYKEELGGRTQEQQNKMFEWIYSLFKDRLNVVFLRSESLDAVSRFGDGYLDFIYLDDDHSYPHVLQELDAWYPKVREGGVFGGHDYGEDLDPTWCGVKRAVDEWAAKNELTVHTQRGLECHGSICDWWVDK